MSGGIQLVPDVAMSYLAENNADFKPIYISVPKKLVGVFDGDAILLYPYEWTEQEAKDWLLKDAEAWKADNKDSLGEQFTR